MVIRRKSDLPRPPGPSKVTSRGAARSDSAAAMSGGTGTFEPYPALNGPQMVFVRLRPGVTPAQGLTSLQRIANAGLAFAG